MYSFKIPSKDWINLEWSNQIKSYGCLKILEEVWVGWTCAEANQQELTTCAKICGRRKEENFGKC
jgi:hypothetical protein